MDLVFPILKRRPFMIFLALLTFACILSLSFLFADSPEKLHGLVDHVKGKKKVEVRKKPNFYDWKTRSAFEPVRFDNYRNASVDELCASFPSFQLDHIQPVLKTGHGVLEARVRPQLNSSLACLNNILTFSDVTEQLENLHLINVLEDVPQDLVDGTEQLESYRRFQACIAKGSGTCADVMTNKEAWSMDKFKFLPMATRAWKMRPEKRWYVFFEADTMVFWDNIFRLLSNFDADVPLYFGSPSPGREGTWFAYGGSGFVLSREAMRRLVKDDWDAETGEYLGSVLTRHYWDELLHDCCGDSLMGWALHTKGVDLGGLWPMYNPHPPHSLPFSDLYWCQPMIGMHKPSEEDVQGIWRWEYGHREYDRSLLFRDLATSYYDFTSPSFERRENWDNSGWDAFSPDLPEDVSEHHLRNPHFSPESCAEACLANEHCMQWTHRPTKCTFVRSVRLGRSRKLGDLKQDEEEKGQYVAGWATERIKKWIDDHPCDQVQWVTPSTERIF